MRTSIVALILGMNLGAFALNAIAAPASGKNRDDVVAKVSGGQVAALMQDYKNAEELCGDAKTVAAQVDPDDFMLAQVELCYAQISLRRNQTAEACAGYLRAESYLNKAVSAKPPLAEPHLKRARVDLDVARDYRKDLRCQ